MTEERNIEEDLKFSPKDGVYQGVKGGLSSFPIIGGPVSNIIANILPSPLEKRKTKWLIEIDRRVKILEKSDKRFKNEELMENENFISIFIYASNIAIKTHHEEKLEALRNAVVNSILLPDVNENLQLLFLNLVDRYTPWHLKILHFFYEILPKSGGNETTTSNINILSYAHDTIENQFRELIGNQDFYEQIVKELVSQGLLEITTSYGKTMTNQKMVAFEMTAIGKKFLEFIEDPNQMKLTNYD